METKKKKKIPWQPPRLSFAIRHTDVLCYSMDELIFGISLVRVSLHDYHLNTIRPTGVLFYSMDGSIFGKILGKGQPPQQLLRLYHSFLHAAN
jgi:hypothetical protein